MVDVSRLLLHMWIAFLTVLFCLVNLILARSLEKEMATHFSILAWEISWTEELGGLQPRGHKESDTT